MEIQAIPFKPVVTAGEYGESAILQTYNYFSPGDPTSGIEDINEIPEPTGKIPWGYDRDPDPFYI